MRWIGYAGAALMLPVAWVLFYAMLSWLFPQHEKGASLARPQPAPTQQAAARPAPARAETYTSEGAQGACILSIPQQMHDPGSVDFLGLTSDWPVRSAAAANTWHVIVPLRARNGFGALVAHEVRCTVRREAGGWRLVGLEALQ